jgi:signal transduction histidine kinase
MDKGTVLMVDDEAEMMVALAELVGQAGYRVETAVDGFKALGKFESGDPDIVLTDLKMPGMDGLELLRKVRARDSDAVVVVMTAFAAVETAVSAMKEGAADYLTKPINTTELVLVLDREMDRRRLRREARQAKLRLEALNRDLDAFAGRVSHDLLTPLTPIDLLAASLERHSDPNVAGKAHRIAGNARRLIEMVTELLAFSRLGRPDKGAVTAAAALTRESLEDFAERIADAQVTVETDLDGEALVACGPSLFRQVLDNLIGNALKHVNGRERRWMRVRLGRKGGSVEIEVEDSGPGIPADSLERIFDLFYRVPGNPVPGSGIGLATVRRIVDANDGQVTVRSGLGQGTTFLVRLPAPKAETEARCVPPAG